MGFDKTKTRVLLLLSCSHRKQPRGLALRQPAPAIANYLPNTRGELLNCRRQVFDLLKGRSSRLYDEEQKGGYRDEHGPNRKLCDGLEFGGQPEPSALYLPAYERYAGRFFEMLTEESPEFWNKIRESPAEVLFVSALYGLILWDEPIQDYDCHVSDRVAAHEDLTVGQSWCPTITDALCEFIKSSGRDRAKGPFSAVFDLLSEDSYQEMLDWERVKRSGFTAEFEVLHRVFLGTSGPDSLPHLAKLLAKQVSRLFPGPQQFNAKTNDWYSIPGEDALPKFGLETLVGSRAATREGDPVEALSRLLRHRPRLKQLQKEVLEQLARAEASWTKVRDSRSFDFGCIAVGYGKAAEAFFRRVLSSARETHRYTRWLISRVRTDAGQP